MPILLNELRSSLQQKPGKKDRAVSVFDLLLIQNPKPINKKLLRVKFTDHQTVNLIEEEKFLSRRKKLPKDCPKGTEDIQREK